jgi:Ser/Thr protein kinase RdoA (MazF antagonist)
VSNGAAHHVVHGYNRSAIYQTAAAEHLWWLIATVQLAVFTSIRHDYANNDWCQTHLAGQLEHVCCLASIVYTVTGPQGAKLGISRKYLGANRDGWQL